VAKPDPLLGETLGEFKIIRLLGVGGMGRVYLAEQAGLEREVAVKILPERMMEDPSTIDRFEREAKLAAKLTHSNIGHVYMIGSEDDVHYVAMELISGGDVAGMMRERKRIPVDEAAEILRQALLGVACAHGSGIVHRDIKPQNLMMSADGTVKVTDFGLARAVEAHSSLTASGTVLGTPLYMSPEQAHSQKVDGRTDIYALGATFYHMICGRPPFEGDTPISVMFKHVGEPLTSPKEIDRGIPEELCAIVEKMMAKKPDDRYQTCEEVLQDLMPFCQAHPVPFLKPMKMDEETSSEALPRFEEEEETPGRAPLPDERPDKTLAVSEGEGETEDRFPSIEVKEGSEALPRFEEQDKTPGRAPLPEGEETPGRAPLPEEGIDRAAETQAAPPDYSEVVKAEPEDKPKKKAKKKKKKKPKEPEPVPEPAPEEDALREAQTQISKSHERRLGSPGRRRRTAVQEAQARKRLALFGGAVAAAALVIGLVYWIANRPPSERPKPTPRTTPTTITQTAVSPVVAERRAPTIYTQWPFDAVEARRRQEETARDLGLPVEKTIKLPGDVEVPLVLIPAGEFEMGISEDEVEALTSNFTDNKWFLPNVTSQAPRHKVRITKPFYLGRYEVTQSQWRAIVAENPSKFRDRKDSDTRPAESVSWDDIHKKFLPKMQPHAEEGWRFRLPTEAEWEYACRAGTATKFYFGDSSAPLTDHGWFKSNSGEETHQVGTRKSNAWGLYDMHGNVWERCQDYFGPDYYKTSPADDPVNTKEDNFRIIRSGAWMNHSGFLPSAYRSRCEPRDRSDFFGLRLVLEIPRKRETLTNSLGMEFVRIPAGEFMMGSSDGEVKAVLAKYPGDKWMLDRIPAEKPEHSVRITRPFFMGKYEVTEAEYKAVTGREIRKGREPRQPAAYVSWDDAQKFIHKLNEQDTKRPTGMVYRLPTEAEWEYACRAGTTTAHFFGSDELLYDDHGWNRRNSGNRSHVVGQKKPNPHGLYDITGNLWEWCEDVFGPRSYTGSPEADPVNHEDGLNRVLRGGAWAWGRVNSRSAHRHWEARQHRGPYVGFRAVLAPKRGYTNFLGMEFADIPVGEFLMGSTPEEIKAYLARDPETRIKSEAPQHRVRISNSFLMGVHEVTVGQFRAFAEATGYKTDTEKAGGTEVLLDGKVQHRPDASWRKPYYEQTDRHPVSSMSWNDAVAFCEWLNANDYNRPAGTEYRLPAEAEWEYAARGPQSFRFPWGNEWDGTRHNFAAQHPHLAENEKGIDDGHPSASPVGAYSPKGDSPFGIADMSGNVWEWCLDLYDTGFYSKVSPDDPVNMMSGKGHVFRGGCWNNTPLDCRSALRIGTKPSSGAHGFGFRVVLARATYTNSIGMRFAKIPPGEFQMGSEQKVADGLAKRFAKEGWFVDRARAEAPRHTVRLTQPFYLGVYEVTQAQYQQAVDKNPSKFKGDRRPVEQVTWAEAAKFCDWLNANDPRKPKGFSYRLPTEAEWEYACQAGAATSFHFGDNAGQLVDYAWVGSNSGRQTHDVGLKKPNPHGLYDLHGNVWEWCLDGLRTYTEETVTDPVGPQGNALRMWRGGAWVSRPETARSQWREWIGPWQRREHLGFRVALARDTLTNSLGMKFVRIPAGEFMMGSTDQEIADALKLNNDDLFREDARSGAPRHKVRITQDFFMGVCEVTQSQYEAVMGTTPSKFRDAKGARPVEQVTWYDAKAFCEWLNSNDDARPVGYEYRLPTEAEWEYACRAGTTTRYSFGDDDGALDNHYWHKGNSGDQTHGVGTKQPNAWGLFDVHGNVWEWCEDFYGPEFYRQAPVEDPVNRMNDGTRVERGGSWRFSAIWGRSAGRHRASPDASFDNLGFRVALAPIRQKTVELKKLPQLRQDAKNKRWALVEAYIHEIRGYPFKADGPKDCWDDMRAYRFFFSTAWFDDGSAALCHTNPTALCRDAGLDAQWMFNRSFADTWDFIWSELAAGRPVCAPSILNKEGLQLVVGAEIKDGQPFVKAMDRTGRVIRAPIPNLGGFKDLWRGGLHETPTGKVDAWYIDRPVLAARPSPHGPVPEVRDALYLYRLIQEAVAHARSPCEPINQAPEDPRMFDLFQGHYLAGLAGMKAWRDAFAALKDGAVENLLKHPNFPIKCYNHLAGRTLAENRKYLALRLRSPEAELGPDVEPRLAAAAQHYEAVAGAAEKWLKLFYGLGSDWQEVVKTDPKYRKLKDPFKMLWDHAEKTFADAAKRKEGVKLIEQMIVAEERAVAALESAIGARDMPTVRRDGDKVFLEPIPRAPWRIEYVDDQGRVVRTESRDTSGPLGCLYHALRMSGHFVTMDEVVAASGEAFRFTFNDQWRHDPEYITPVDALASACHNLGFECRITKNKPLGETLAALEKAIDEGKAVVAGLDHRRWRLVAGYNKKEGNYYCLNDAAWHTKASRVKAGEAPSPFLPLAECKTIKIPTKDFLSCYYGPEQVAKNTILVVQERGPLAPRDSAAKALKLALDLNQPRRIGRTNFDLRRAAGAGDFFINPQGHFDLGTGALRKWADAITRLKGPDHNFGIIHANDTTLGMQLRRMEEAATYLARVAGHFETANRDHLLKAAQLFREAREVRIHPLLCSYASGQTVEEVQQAIREEPALVWIVDYKKRSLLGELAARSRRCPWGLSVLPDQEPFEIAKRVAAANLLHIANLRDQAFAEIEAVVSPRPAKAVVPAPKADGLIAWYPFSGNVREESGNPHESELKGAGFTIDRFGRTNYALRLIDKAGLLIRKTPKPGPELTLSVWARPLRNSHAHEWSDFIFHWGGNQNYGILGVHTPTKGPSAGRPCFNWDHHYTKVKGKDEGGGFIDADRPIVSGRWYHLAVTFAGDRYHLYIDGVKQRDNTPGKLPLVGDLITIGCSNKQEDKHFFLGAIDDLRIYSRALSPAEIQELHHEHDYARPTYRNSLGMGFVRIPRGVFQMGSLPAETQALLLGHKGDEFLPFLVPGEVPRHQVRLTADFLLGATEVTQAQYTKATGQAPSRAKGPNRPVEQVTWDQARAFCEWLNQNDAEKPFGFEYRLPTEAEREYACRAGTTALRYCGDDPAALANYEWYKNNSGDKTHDVATKLPNPWGLYDMSGNVLEWCEDHYSPEFYKHSPADDPLNTKVGTQRALRVAGFLNPPQHCRSAMRTGAEPGSKLHDRGFRVVLAPSRDYLVVDLTAGKDAKGYPVTKLNGAPPDLLTNKEGPNGTNKYQTTHLVLRRIPRGTSTVGSPKTEFGRHPKRPKCEPITKTRTTRDLFAGVFEVTQAQYERVMGADPSEFEGRPENPVDSVSWNDVRGGTWPKGKPAAETFLGRLSARTGRECDLPTSAQWEGLCRAGWDTGLNNGKELTAEKGLDTALDEVAWYEGNSGKTTHPVGEKAANAWGLYDMHGNVWEWCLDWFEEVPVVTGPDPAGPATGEARTRRGGSWGSQPCYCRSAFSWNNGPEERHPVIGFRVVMLPPEQFWKKFDAGGK